MKEEIQQLQRDKELEMAELQLKIENLRREEEKMQKHHDDLNKNTQQKIMEAALEIETLQKQKQDLEQRLEDTTDAKNEV